MKLWLDIQALESLKSDPPRQEELVEVVRTYLREREEAERKKQERVLEIRRSVPWARRRGMSPSRGHKHTCINPSCGKDFYDMRRSPAECPKCGQLQTNCPVCDREIFYDDCHRKGRGGFECDNDACLFYKAFEGGNVPIKRRPCEHCDRSLGAGECAHRQAQHETPAEAG